MPAIRKLSGYIHPASIL